MSYQSSGIDESLTAAHARIEELEDRLEDGSRRMLELVEKHHEVIAERDSALLRLDTALSIARSLVAWDDSLQDWQRNTKSTLGAIIANARKFSVVREARPSFAE